MSVPYVVEPVDAAAGLDLARALRHAVFTVEQGIPAELDDDGADHRSLHVIAWKGDRAVATARLTPGVDGTGVVSRVAVDKAHRGRGLGARLVVALERLAVERGLERLTLSPHDYLEPFYARLGYRRLPGTEQVAGHRLIKMGRALP